MQGTDKLTTPVTCAGLPNPQDGAQEVLLNKVLSWGSVTGATSYDVYFGTVNPPTAVYNVTTASYNPGALAGDTTYYWKVIPKNSCSTLPTCGVWNFTTHSAGTCTDDSYEENDQQADAKAVTGSPTGTTYSSLRTCDSDNDWYKVQLNAEDALTVTIDFTHRLGDLDLQLYDPSGTILDASAGVTDSETVDIASAATAGYYYIYILGYQGAENTYSMTVTVVPPIPAAPAAPTFANIGCTSLTVNWAAVYGATSYDLYRKAGACGTGTVIGPNLTGTTYNDTGLTASTQYSYYLVAKNGYGSSPVGACAPVTTTPPIPAAPAAPSFTNINCTTLTINWSTVSGATGYDLYRKTGACGTGTVIAPNQTGTTYNDTSLTESTQYSYYLVAKNACGNSGSGACASSTTTAPIPSAPVAPTYTAVNCTSLTVNWAAVSGATSYDLYRVTGACGTGTTIATNLATTTYNDTGLTASTQYSYYLVAKNTCGSSAAGTCSSTTTTAPAPAAPAAPTYASVSCSTLTVNWAAVSGATAYDLYRKAGACGTGTTIATNLAVTTYNDTGLTGSTQYSYYLVAKNACGTSTAGACSSVTTTAQPGVPGAPTFTGTSCNAVTVNWGAVSGATSYDLYRKVGVCGTGTIIATNLAATTYTNTGLTANTQYNYYLVAKNACGSSTAGTCASVTTTGTPPAPANVTATGVCTGITVAWDPVAGATSYTVYRGTTCGVVVTTFAGKTSPFTDITPVAGITYQYWVKAVSATCGISVNSACASAKKLQAPTAPTAPTYTNISCSTMTVNWTAVATAANYDLYRKAGVCGAGTVIAADLTGTTYNDSGLTANTQYSYYLRAKNACGSSTNGACLAITTTGTPATPSAPTYANISCSTLTVNWTTASGATSPTFAV